MRCILPVALLSLAALPGCGNPADCAKSADIQVTVAPNEDVPVAQVVRLHVMLSVADVPVGANDILVGPELPLKSAGSAFILRPDPAPSATYDVSLTVQAFASGNVLVAIGSDSLQAVSNGCNKMTVHLTALPVAPVEDMAAPPGADLAGTTPPQDMTGCVGGTPDEDSDGRANFCDLCPDDADPTPADSDGDGLPDACDPDVAAKSNTLLYADLMDAASGHWSGANAISGSFMTLDSGPNVLTSNNGVDQLPTNVRVQSHIFLKAVYTNTPFSDTGIYVGNDPNPASATANGVLCTLHYHPNMSSDTLDIYPVTNGVLGTPTTTSTQFNPAMYRMRLTQRSTGWTCETVANGISPATVTLSHPVTGPLFMSLRSENMEAHMHAVVAESALP